MVKSVHNILSPLKQYVFVICPSPKTHMTATTLSTPCQNETFKRNHRAACRTKDGVQSLISGWTVTIKCCGRLILSFCCPIIDRERRDYLKFIAVCWKRWWCYLFLNLFSEEVSLCHSEAEKRRIAPCKDVESGILGFGIWNTALGLRNPTKDSNPESKFYRKILESSTWSPESTAWNPESKTVQDSLTCGETYRKLAGLLTLDRDLKIRRRGRQRERQKKKQ